MAFTKTEVNGVQRFGEITLEIEERVKVALSLAALAGTAKANEVAGKYTTFHYARVRGTIDGYESGVVSENRLMANLYDYGTLGKRKRKLKQPGRRKQTWIVKQKKRTYEAHRRDTTGKGVAGVGFSAKARATGRKVLLAELDRLPFS